MKVTKEMYSAVYQMVAGGRLLEAVRHIREHMVCTHEDAKTFVIDTAIADGSLNFGRPFEVFGVWYVRAKSLWEFHLDDHDQPGWLPEPFRKVVTVGDDIKIEHSKTN
jgi:hypothetical protein